MCFSPLLKSSWFALGLCYFCQASLHKQLRALGCSACASWQAASQLGLLLGALHPLRCADHLEEKFVDAIRRIQKNCKFQMRASNITNPRLQMNFDSRKFEQKWMSRWLRPTCFCDSRVCLRLNFEIQWQDAFQSGNQRYRSNFFPRLRKMQWCEGLS